MLSYLKNWRISIALTVVALWTLTSPTFVQATVFPERLGANTDIVYLDDPRVDFSLRFRLVREAKHSIDIISFIQGTDEVGMPFLKALRDAANRDIPIRYIYELLPSASAGDRGARSAWLLSDPSLSRPARVSAAHAYQKLISGVSLNDFVHHKILIIDGGTPDEKILIGGRGYSSFSLETADSAYLLRPIDPLQSHAGRDIRRLFESLWLLMQSVSPPDKSMPVSSDLLKEVRNAPDHLLRTEAQRREFETLWEILKNPPLRGGSLPPFEFQPDSVQIVSNDLLKSVLATRADSDMSARNLFHNDILEQLVPLIRGARSVDMTSYVIGPPSALGQALQQSLNNGGRVRLFTNGQVAHQKLFPGGTPVDYTLETLLPMLSSGTPPELHLLNGTRALAASRDESPVFGYIHRKLLLLDDIVVTGSDNFTRSSAYKNDEMILVARDSRMAAYMRGITEKEMPSYDRVEGPEAIRLFQGRPWYSDYMQSFIQSIY